MKRIRLKRIILLGMVVIMLVCSFFSVSGTTVVVAAEEMYTGSDGEITVADAKPWIEGDPAQIYPNNTTQQGVQKVELPKPNWFESLLIGLVKGIADFISAIQDAAGLSPEQIIYGRVSPKSKGVNYFKFELAIGNPYGLVGTYVYGTIQTVCMVIMWLIFASQLLKYMIWTSSRTKEEVKASITKLFVCTVLMFIMPQIWHTVNYMFDIVLAVLYQKQGGIIPSSANIADTGSIEGIANVIGTTSDFSGGIMAIFRTMASASLVGASLYLAVTLLWIYFAYVYLGITMGMIIYFIFFPVVCVMSYMDKNITGSWIKNVLQGFLVPILDAILFMVPALVFYVMAASVNIIFTAVVTFLSCMLIIPARNLVKNLLGINVGGISSLTHAGLGAIALLQGARMLAGGVGRVAGHVREARDAGHRAKMMEELAQAEGMSGGEVLAFAGAGGGSVPPLASGSIGGLPISGGSTSSPSMAQSSTMNADYYRAEASDIAVGRTAVKGKLQIAKDNLGNQERAMRDIEQKVISVDGREGLGSPIYENEDGSGVVIGYSGLNPVDSAAYRKYALSAQSTRADISMLTEQSAGFDNQHSGVSAMASRASYNEKMSAQMIAQRKQAIIDKYASIGMVGRPEFSHVSPARQAELLRTYSRRQALRAATSAVGGVTGAGLGFTGTVFYGPAMMAVGVGGGTSLGSATGSAYGEMMVAGAQYGEERAEAAAVAGVNGRNVTGNSSK